MKVAAIVPSLNPDEKFTDVIDDLVDAGFTRIYVVNDGSSDAYQRFFDHAASYTQCILLTHKVNEGKGRALKTAFARHLEDPGNYVGLVTLDGDGQHHIDDVVAVAKALEQQPEHLIIGARDFSQSHVPTKNAIGNKLTRSILGFAIGTPITDTQTGLRGISNSFAKALLDVSGERYEYETNMLLETKRAHVTITEVPISTIYIDNNSASHFRPLVDGMRIYILILKFAFSSFASFLVDFTLFTLFNWLLKEMPGAQRLLIATVAARICSAFFNFLVNRSVVFKSNSGFVAAIVRYAILCAVQMLCSYGGVYLLSEVLPLQAWLSKILVDGTLFFISFFIQRRWVFKAQG